MSRHTLRAVTPPGDVPPLHVRVMGVTIEIDGGRRGHARPVGAPVVAGRGRRPVGRGRGHGRARRPGRPAESADARDYALTTQVTLAALTGHRGGAVQPARRRAGGRRRTGARARGPVRHRQDHGHPVARRTTGLPLRRDRLDHPGRRRAPAREAAVRDHRPRATRDKEQLSPDDLGLRPTPDSGRLARFVVLRRGVPDPRGLVRLEPMEALLNLIEQSSSVSRGGRPPRHPAVARRVATGGVWALEYDEISEHLDELERLLAARHRARGPTPSLLHHPGDATERGDRSARRGHAATAALGGRDRARRRGPRAARATRAVRLDHLMATAWLELDHTAHPRRARRRGPGAARGAPRRAGPRREGRRPVGRTGARRLGNAGMIEP